MRLPRGEVGLDGLRREITTGPVIGRILFCLKLTLADLFNVLGGAETIVGLPGRNKPFGMLAVDRKALRLNIGAEGSCLVRSLVVIDSRPVESFDQVLNGPLDLATLIRIFDAKYQFSAVVAGKEKIVQGGSESANV